MYPLPLSNLKSLELVCAPVLALEETTLGQMVPPQAGFWFSECPNCNQGAQEHQLVWTPELGEKVQCQFCKQIYPNAQYPENGSVAVRTPSGGTQVWRFHENAKEQRYWYEARRWYETKLYLEKAAFNLAQLGARTKNKDASRRAALLLTRFAEVYGDYIVHSDFPHQPKEFFETTVPARIEPYRAAKWTWWAYGDISVLLLQTQDLLQGTEFLSADAAKRVEERLFRPMLAFVAQYEHWQLTNMHPTTWNAMAVASRVLRDDALMAKTISQMNRLIDEQFFSDGMYKEGTASYHQMTVVGLNRVLVSLYPELSPSALNAKIVSEYPPLYRALTAAQRLRLPDGRFAPQRDTWASQKSDDGPLPESKPVLLPGMGYAILGTGSGAAQLQAHLAFTGRFGHNHFDSLNLLLYGCGKELASDIGYTHSRARSWTISTAAHNTVVIDQRSQSTGDVPDRCRGRLLLFDGTDKDFQMVMAEAPTAYPGVATAYRRALITVTSGETRYVVDVFDVAGGKRHDWLLHGSADDEQTVELTVGGKPLPLESVPSLLPNGHTFVEPKSEKDQTIDADESWAYGLFRSPKIGASNETIVATFRGTENPRIGLQSWVMGVAGTKAATASAWAVRNIGKPTQEDDSKLDQRLRQAVMIQRQGMENRFVAVHCPFDGSPGVKNVEQHSLEPGGVLLKIELTNGITDYLLFGADAATRTGRDGSLRFAFDGQAALVRLEKGAHVLKRIGGTELVFGNETLVGTASPTSARLLAVSGQDLTVAGNLPVEAGMAVIVRHGDGTTTSFNIAAVRYTQSDTVLTTEEAPTLTGSPNGPLTLRPFPKTTHPAPHEVHLVTRAAHRIAAKG